MRRSLALTAVESGSEMVLGLGARQLLERLKRGLVSPIEFVLSRPPRGERRPRPKLPLTRGERGERVRPLGERELFRFDFGEVAFGLALF